MIRARTGFLLVLAVIMAMYTQLAMQMDWRTAAGRIGPGFFPRIVGFAAIVLCLVAAVRSVRSDKEPLEGHGRELLLFVAASIGFLVLLVPLGAVLASSAFLMATLTLLDRGRLVRNLAISLLLPLGLYLWFQLALNAGLPAGVLPLR